LSYLLISTKVTGLTTEIVRTFDDVGGTNKTNRITERWSVRRNRSSTLMQKPAT